MKEYSSKKIAERDKFNCVCQHNKDIEISCGIRAPGASYSSYPESATMILDGLTFACSDSFLVKGQVQCAGNPDWLQTHLAPAQETSPVIEVALSSLPSPLGKQAGDYSYYCYIYIYIFFLFFSRK